MKVKGCSIAMKNFIRTYFRYLGYSLNKIGPYSVFDFESFLYRYLAVHNSLIFIQIGANDGVMNDPIYQFNVNNKAAVSGFVIEPLPDVFENLVKNYKSCPNIKPINVAIHETESEMAMYRIRPEYMTKVPEAARGIASFDREHWQKSGLVKNENYLEEVKVSCISFSNFIKVHNIQDVDLLLLDTEGHDFQILMSLDFSHTRPKIIRFEHGVRDGVMSHNDFVRVCSYLNSFGYQIIAESYDATAYLLDPVDLIF